MNANQDGHQMAAACPFALYTHLTQPFITLPGHIAQSVTCLATDASLTADLVVLSLILARSHTLIMI